MVWEKCKYSKDEINQAGRTLIKNGISEEEENKAIEILDNWRAVHGYPMHIFQMTLKKKATSIDETALVSQRLKRTPAIRYKLGRSYKGHKPSMKLYQMQDIGGCRAVLPNVELARKLWNQYIQGDLKHKLVNKKNYIDSPNPADKIDGPKEDGYRGFHLVYAYKSDKGKKEFDGLLTEIQIRSKLQHIWATAVETTGFFTRQAIKSNEGGPEWIEFFKLVSSAFAKMEGCHNVPNTPENEKELYLKIKEKEKELNFIGKVRSWTSIISLFDQEMGRDKQKKKKIKFFLLELDILGKKIMISTYTDKEEQKAIDAYSALEKRHLGNKDYDIVLVGADNTRDLKKAYPSYFLDIAEFLKNLEKIIKKYPTI